MDDGDARDQENLIAGVYSGPLDEFVSRRDALAKELRSAGDRESATAVKALRKPARLAWALNLGVQNDRRSFAALEAAVAGTLAAQAAGGDVRAAMAELRGAVRSLASESADAAERAGHRVDAGALSNAVLAVVGRPDSFEQLRSRRLADVPDAGGLDFLDSLPTPSRAAAAPSTVHSPATVPEQEVADDAAARENARRAAEALAPIRALADAAEQELREADSEVAAALERLRMAESDLAAAQKRRDSAHRDAEAAGAELRRAETASAEAQRGNQQRRP